MHEGIGKWVGSNKLVKLKLWSRKWQPTSVFLPANFHGQRTMASYSPWGQKELDVTEHKLESSLLGEISTISDMQMVPP